MTVSARTEDLIDVGLNIGHRSVQEDGRLCLDDQFGEGADYIVVGPVAFAEAPKSAAQRFEERSGVQMGGFRAMSGVANASRKDVVRSLARCRLSQSSHREGEGTCSRHRTGSPVIIC